jgi:hypothetical protein
MTKGIFVLVAMHLGIEYEFLMQIVERGFASGAHNL